MARNLNPDEAALWARVTAHVTAEANKPRPSRGETRADPLPLPTRSRAPGVTLDAAWDRRLRLGMVEPDRSVDLHELRLDGAHTRIIGALTAAARRGDRLVLVVTGKPPPPGSTRLDAPLRGIIRASIEDWIAASGIAGAVAAIRPAHRRHGGNGALYIVMRRVRAQRLF